MKTKLMIIPQDEPVMLCTNPGCHCTCISRYKRTYTILRVPINPEWVTASRAERTALALEKWLPHDGEPVDEIGLKGFASRKGAEDLVRWLKKKEAKNG
jgi:hypothetical protein